MEDVRQMYKKDKQVAAAAALALPPRASRDLRLQVAAALAHKTLDEDEGAGDAAL